MRRGTTEYGLGVMFGLGDGGIKAHKPLGTSERLMDPNFKVPFSFVYGDELDWVKKMDEGYSKYVIEQKNSSDCLYTIVPDGSHNLMMDNPVGTANAILNSL